MTRSHWDHQGNKKSFEATILTSYHWPKPSSSYNISIIVHLTRSHWYHQGNKKTFEATIPTSCHWPKPSSSYNISIIETLVEISSQKLSPSILIFVDTWSLSIRCCSLSISSSPLVEIIQLAMIKYRTLSKTLIQFKFKRKFVSRNYFLSHPLHMELY